MYFLKDIRIFKKRVEHTLFFFPEINVTSSVLSSHSALAYTQYLLLFIQYFSQRLGCRCESHEITILHQISRALRHNSSAVGFTSQTFL